MQKIDVSQGWIAAEKYGDFSELIPFSHFGNFAVLFCVS
jgi:hypothetical protein